MKSLLISIILFGCNPNLAQDFFPISKLYYDIEAKPKTASFPVPDSIIVAHKGDTLRISWAHSVEKATVSDSMKAWDQSGGWFKIAQGLQELNAGVVNHLQPVELETGAWTFRIWAWYFKGQGVWIKSPAPSDEIELSILEQQIPPGEGEEPRPPMLIEIKIK